MNVRILAVVALLVPALTGCPRATLDLEVPGLADITGSRLSDEEQIARVLDDVHRGMESRRIYKVLAHVSKNYYDEEGRDYAAIQAYLNRLFSEYRDIRITRARPQVFVQGNRARALETFGTNAAGAGPGADRMLSLQGQVTVYFEKIGGTWQIVQWGTIR